MQKQYILSLCRFLSLLSFDIPSTIGLCTYYLAQKLDILVKNKHLSLSFLSILSQLPSNYTVKVAILELCYCKYYLKNWDFWPFLLVWLLPSSKSLASRLNSRSCTLKAVAKEARWLLIFKSLKAMQGTMCLQNAANLWTNNFPCVWKSRKKVIL